jgi:hypothetical protein
VVDGVSAAIYVTMTIATTSRGRVGAGGAHAPAGVELELSEHQSGDDYDDGMEYDADA